MNRYLSALFAVLCLGMVSGCASLNQDECLNANWFTLGYVDGANGVLATRVGDYQSDCAAFNVTPDFESYERGHDKGAREYCTPLNGFKHGRRGNDYNGICPEEVKGPYLKALSKGKDHHRALELVREAEINLSQVESNIAHIHDEIAKKEAIIVEDATSKETRIRLLDDIKLLQNDIFDLEADFVLLEQERINRLDRVDFLERRDSHLMP